MKTKFILLILLILPIVSADINLYNADIKINEFCLDQPTDITIYPKDIMGNLSIIDSINISSNLSFKAGDMIFENNSFIKSITFSEKGNTRLSMNVSQEEKTLFFEKDITVTSCSFDIAKKGDSVYLLVKRNMIMISIGLGLIVFLMVLTIVLKIAK